MKSINTYPLQVFSLHSLTIREFLFLSDNKEDKHVAPLPSSSAAQCNKSNALQLPRREAKVARQGGIHAAQRLLEEERSGTCGSCMESLGAAKGLQYSSRTP